MNSGRLANQRVSPPHSAVTALAKSGKRRAAGRAGYAQRLARTERARRMIHRMAGPMILTGLLCGAGRGSLGASDQATALPKVEFKEVTGAPCLQAVVSSPDAELNDFRLAESRWLSEHYPGRPVPRWQN